MTSWFEHPIDYSDILMVDEMLREAIVESQPGSRRQSALMNAQQKVGLVMDHWED